jgi:hypothetical protein
VGRKCRNVFCFTHDEVFGAENAIVEHERTIEHRRVASAISRRSVDAKLEGIYISVDGERQAASEGGANTTSGTNSGCGTR